MRAAECLQFGESVQGRVLDRRKIDTGSERRQKNGLKIRKSSRIGHVWKNWNQRCIGDSWNWRLIWWLFFRIVCEKQATSRRCRYEWSLNCVDHRADPLHSIASHNELRGFPFKLLLLSARPRPCLMLHDPDHVHWLLRRPRYHKASKCLDSIQDKFKWGGSCLDENRLDNHAEGDQSGDVGEENGRTEDGKREWRWCGANHSWD